MKTRLAAVLALSSLLLVACATDGRSDSPGGGAAQDTGKGLIVWTDDTRAAPVKKYAEAHPELQITQVTQESSAGSVPTKLALAKQSGNGVPDVIFVGNPDEIASLAANPLAFTAPLNDLVPPGTIEKFAPGTVDRCTVEGKVLCLPNDIAQTVLWYNDALMKEFGYQVPTSWQEYADLGAKLSREHPGYLIGSAAGKYGLYGYYGSSGCPFSVARGPLELTVNTQDQKCSRVSELLAPLVANKTVTTISPLDPATAKLGNENKILMMPGASWFGEFAFKPTYKTPTGQLAAAQMPTWPGENQPMAGAVGGGLWVVSKSSGNPKAAVDLAVAMSTDVELQRRSATYPAATDAAAAWLQDRSADPFYASDPGPALLAEAALINPSQSYVRHGAQVLDSYSQVVVPALGTPDPDAGLKTWGEQIRQAAQGAGYRVG